MHTQQFVNRRRASYLALIAGLAICPAQRAEPAPFAKVQPLELDSVHWTRGASRMDWCVTRDLSND